MALPPEYDPVSWAPSNRDPGPQSSFGHQQNNYHNSTFNAYQYDPFMVAIEGSLVRSSRNSTEILSICFDPKHEVLWTANASGRVNGFDVEQLRPVYTFLDSRAPILHIDAYDEAIAVVTADTFSMYNRHGHCCYRHQTPQFEQLRCVHRPSPHQTKVFIGGMQSNISLFDIEAQRQIRSVVDDATGVTMMRSNQSNLICANDRGNITIRSLAGDKVSEIQAHLGPITGFDVCGNQLVTAGCTIKPGYYNDPFGTPRGDPFLKVFDLRFMSASQPLQTPFPPQHVYFGDPHNGTIIMTSHFGHLWSGNINNPSARQPIQEMPYGSFNHLAMSSSKRCIATVDNNQYGRVYSPYNQAQGLYGVVNYRSRALSPHQYYHKEPVVTGFRSNHTGFMNVQPPMPSVHRDFHGSPMPMMCGPSSDAVSDVSERMGALSFDPSQQGRMGGDRNNSDKSRSAAYIIKRAGAEMPRNIYADGHFRDVRGLSRTLVMPEWLRAQNDLPLPRFYARPSDKDRHVKAIYERYNGTQQVALLMNAEAPVVNSFIRAIAAVPPIKKLILSHLCRRRNCILCELHFIVRNIHAQEADQCITPLTCNAIIREMAAYADFGAIKDLTAAQFCGLAVTLFCNFFLHHIFLESSLAYDGNSTTDLHINKALEVIVEKSSSCSFCGSSIETAESRHVITLRYPYAFDGNHVPFVQLLEDSFDDTALGPMQVNQCGTCFRMAPRRIKTTASLPSVLAVDTCINREGYVFWNQNADTACSRPVSSMNNYDPRFVREGSPHNHVVNFHERTLRGVSDAVHSGVKFDYYVPSMISAVVNPDGKVSFSGSIVKNGNNKVYALCSAVMSIADGPDSEHYISICKGDNPQSPVLNWTVFNDYIVTPVKVDEALYSSSAWKMPHLLFYCDVEKLNMEVTPVPIPREVFDDERPENGTHERVPPPPAGEIVALDSEFVQNESKEHVLGRISCLNSEGEPIIDDYSLLGTNELISDYLTPFSGIVHEDLNPATSTKYLLSRKKSYLKVLYLVENRNVFVGHALHNDFRILNLYIPAEQIIDTCELYRLDGKQCLSLRGLVDHVFGETIQSSRHDSVEDALSALRLFKKYKTQEEENADITSWLRDIYDETQKRSAQETHRHFVAPRSNMNSGYLPYMYPTN